MKRFESRRSRLRFRALPLPLRLISWSLILAQLFLPFNNLLSAAEVTVPPPRVRYPEPVLTPKEVKVNRTLPEVSPPPTELRFSEIPTDAEILGARVFRTPLVSSGGFSSERENQDLAAMLLSYQNRADAEDGSAIEAFLQSHPDSGRRVSLLAQLASHYRGTCQFSKALEIWEQLWALGRDVNEPNTKAVVDQSVAEWADFLVTLGRMDDLRVLLAQIVNRPLCGPAAVLAADARSALWQMENRPEQTFKCGPFSLYRIRAALKLPNPAHPLIHEELSTTNGTSLYQNLILAQKMGMDYQMAKRRPGASIPLPAMIHWKLGHCSAVIGYEEGKYLMEDPTFAPSRISESVLDEEASGYFLIPDGLLPTGWSPVNEAEGRTVWGRSTPTRKNANALTPCDDKTSPCGGTGMAGYSVHLMQVSLSLSDAPVGYQPPVGPAVVFRATYNERDTNQLSGANYSNLGNQWTFDWLSYIQDGGAATNYPTGYSAALCRTSGGGAEVHERDTTPGGRVYIGIFPPNTDFMPHPRSQARLKKTSSTSYERLLPDGSKQIYSWPDSGSPRKVFMTSLQDPAGNALTFTYDAHFRMVAASDAIGQVTTISYGSTNIADSLYYKITKVTDPFGRYATFLYNSTNQLTNITDVIGITSAFAYGGQYEADFINSLTTPYGTTTFTNGSYGFNQWLEITDPDGSKQRVEFNGMLDPTLGVFNEPSIHVPTNVMVDHLEYDNTFYWDKKAMDAGPGDITKAHIYHWLSAPDNYGVVAGTKASEKRPLENRVWYEYPGEIHGDWGFLLQGTNDRPSKVACFLDDDSEQITQFSYNSVGKTTTTIDPLRRATTFAYDSSNPENLVEVRQLVGAGNDLLARFSYNSQRLPLTAVDASGQTNYFGYNAQGQLLAATNALGETVTMTYDVTRYLTNVTGALPGATTSFTYDGYGRARTVTDAVGYAVTYDYDAFDRPTKVTYPDITFEQIVYEKLDPVLSKDRRGRWSRKIYDSLRRLGAVQDALGRVTQLGWCTCGTLSSLTDPLGRTTTWLRDLEGRVTSKVYPDSSLVSYAYEIGMGRIKSVTDSKNQTTLYDYFIDNNLKQVTYSNAGIVTPPVAFTYDMNYNRLLAMTDGVGTTAYGYNAIGSPPSLGAGRLATVDGPWANDTISYYYDALGRMTNRAINGFAQTVAFDALGRVTVMTNALGRFTNAYVGVTARISTNYYPNGQKAVCSYFGTNGDIRLQTIWYQNPSGVTLSKFDYTYDAEGQIATWAQQEDTQTPIVWTTEYDPVDQLLGVAVRSNSIAGTMLKQFIYSYDKAGNRTSETVGTSSTSSQISAAFNPLNQLTNIAGPSTMRFKGHVSELGTVTIAGNTAPVDSRNTNFVGYATVTIGTNIIQIVATDASSNKQTNNYQIVVTNGSVAQTLKYDLSGNLTNVITATSTNSYDWDAVNRLVRITQTSVGNPQLISEFLYDGGGRRVGIVEKTNGVATTNRFLWCGLELCEQREVNGGTVTKRFFGQGEQISGTAYFFTHDHLGTVREMTDGAGATRARYEYTPYGRRTKVSGDLEADFGLTGFYVHSPSQLYLALRRAYDPSASRWLNRDPIGERGGLNLYGFVGNNPTRYVDTFGLDYGDWFDPRTWFNSGLSDSWYESANSIGQALGGAFAGNSDQVAAAYDSGIFGQTEDSGWVTYYGTRGAVVVATACAAGAVAVGTLEAVGCSTMNVAVGPGQPAFIHVAYGTGDTWVAATGAIGAQTVWGGFEATLYAEATSWFTVTGIPVLFPEAVTATTVSAWTCVGAACRAALRGWGL